MGKERGRRLKSKDKNSKKAEDSDAAAAATAVTVPAVEQKSEIPNVFFGLVDPQENSYFKEAENTLKVNFFENDEDKALYVNSVFEECKGKELKLVSDQICSKLIERLILNGTPKQIKSFFRAFSGHFPGLAVRKYSSHCLETLFIKSASIIEKEILTKGEEDDDEETITDELYAPMESLFSYMLNEFKPYVKELVNHQYGSHVLRVILLILSGKELPSATVGSSLLRSKKSKVARKMIEIKDTEEFKRSYQVPESFKNEELKSLLDSLYAGQTRESLRQLALDKIGSPVLQLCIQLEGMVNKEREFYHTIFLKMTDEKDQSEGAFVEYLLSDAVGSHFLEAVIKYALQRNVDRLYKLYMKERILKLAQRANTGLFVVQALLFRLTRGEVKYIIDQLLPELHTLIDLNLDMAKSIINASTKNKDYKKQEILDSILSKYNKDNMIEDILKLEGSTLGNTNDDWPTAEERWRTLFFEQLVSYDAQLLEFALESFINLDSAKLIQMCFHGVFSHAVESVLLIDASVVQRRKLLNKFMGHIVELACNAYGSHIVDKLWDFSFKLTNYKEKICMEMINSKDKVKESNYGKLVWRNWKLDLFTRKRSDWNFAVKQQEIDRKKELEASVESAKTESKKDTKDATAPGNKRKFQGGHSKNYNKKVRA